MAQVAIGMYRTVTEATWAAAGFTVFGTTIMGVQATWDERVLAAVELAGWATLGLEASGFAGGVSRGSFLDEATDVATGGGRTTRGVDGAADAAGITRHADEATDPFSSSQWARVAYSPNRTRATGNGPDFDPVGSMDDVGAPRGITGGTRSQATADATSRQKNDQIPRANRTFAKDFYIHGTSPGSLVPFVTDSGKPIAVSDVVKRIKASPGWAPGVPVRLVSCHSAKSGAASAVAAQLKTPVMAPTHRVSIGSDGSFRFHGDRLPPDPTDLDASGTPRVRYADPPADAGWIRYDENGSVVGRLDMDGVWHEGGGS